MTFNRRAAVAAGVATICILTGTMALAQSVQVPHARYVAAAAPAAPAAAS
jgi:hypothetical protein